VSTPRRLYPRRGTVALTLLILFGALVAADQQQSQPPPPSQTPPQFKAGTNFVRVDVYATRNGVPVEDLTAAEFDVAEDGAAQKIETFEHIVVRPTGPQEDRVEPSSVSQANQLAADPRRRVFVLFLDTATVSIEGSHAIKEPLIQLMTNLLGPDDLVGVMTPDMGPDEITFGRKTQVIEDGLRNNWTWGRRDSLLLDEQEQKYDACFPPLPGERSPSALAQALIDRRRERIVLDSLQDTIRHMAAIREGRTAVVAVSDGWLLYPPNEALTHLRVDPMTGGRVDPTPGTPPPVGVGPGGTLTTKDSPNQPFGTLKAECDRDQMELAMADNRKYFRDILGEANRANVSFYPIDPRGMPAFDTPIGPAPPLPLEADRAALTNRIESLHVLAENTDGIALLNSNDLVGQMRRLAADLTSYYLIGYSSTNTKLDGGFRNIKVRVKRPGIEIRARHGYRAATAAELASSQKTASAPAPATDTAFTTALGSLARDARPASADGARFRTFDAPGDPVVFHRGASTGNQMQRANGRLFSRTERLHLELAATDIREWSGVLLDRNAKPLQVPVTTGERTDAATGQRWLTADLVLAPLGAGDYVIELTTHRPGEEQKILTAIRVTQ
jgi:VWFA-related protein